MEDMEAILVIIYLLYMFGHFLLKQATVVTGAVLLIVFLVLLVFYAFGAFKNAEPPSNASDKEPTESNPGEVQSAKQFNKRPSEPPLWKADDLF